ncbi:MAG: phosphoglycerate kinase [Chitinophagales bacterium]|nr:phosphoglycerate kinase [Hyphomicrobiales bacterium]
MEGIRSITHADVKGRTVLVRADLNVPMDGAKVSDATRIDRFAPTVKILANRGARVVILSHFGRPDGKPEMKYSLRPITGALAEALGEPVKFIADCAGDATAAEVASVPYGGVAVLENVRFHPGEEENDPKFAQKLASLGDFYVNDAFSCSHRAHASMHALAAYLPAYAGPSMMAEIEALSAALVIPQRPVAALVGGAKVSSKIAVLEHLLNRVDVLIIGGGMANTFLLAMGHNIGKSLAEPAYADKAREIIAAANARGSTIVIPVDATLGEAFTPGARNWVENVGSLSGEGLILDIGPRSVEDLTARLNTCRTLLWNGPLGAFEIEPFGQGTFEVARAAARLTKQGRLITVAGGGDTVSALNAAGVTDDFTYVSTAGGAFLEWLEGKDLPGVAVLKQSFKASLEGQSWRA